MSTQNQTPGVPTELFASGSNVVIEADPDSDILNNELAGEEQGQTKEAVTTPPLTGADPTALAMLRVAESMEKIVSRNESTRQLSYAEITKNTAGNPTGDPNHPSFKRPTYMHGIRLSSLQITAEQIRLFNQLKPGRYCDRKVEVQLTRAGELNIQWAGSKIDQRMEIYLRYPDLTIMLKEIIAERAAKEAKRRAGQFDEDEQIA